MTLGDITGRDTERLLLGVVHTFDELLGILNRILSSFFSGLAGFLGGGFTSGLFSLQRGRMALLVSPCAFMNSRMAAVSC